MPDALCLLLCIFIALSLHPSRKRLNQEESEVANSMVLLLLGTSHSTEWNAPKFTFFAKGNPLTNLTLENVEATDENVRNKRFAFITHGYLTTTVNKHAAMNKLKETIFKFQEFDYVVIVDWTEASQRDYITCKSCLWKESEAIKRLIVTMKIRLHNIELYGHSLGAHIMGTVARKLQHGENRVFRVVGLDPAGIFLNKNYPESPNDEITSDVADEVIVINTLNIWGMNDETVGTHIIFIPDRFLRKGVMFYDDLLGVNRHAYAWYAAATLIRINATNPWDKYKVIKYEYMQPRGDVNEIIIYSKSVMLTVISYIKAILGYDISVSCP